MTIYNVHVYREMRITYEGIEADTPQIAAAIAREKGTGDADDINDCEGVTFAALVNVVGDADYENSVTIDFEHQRLLNAAPRLLAALQAIVVYAENGHTASISTRKIHRRKPKRAWKAIQAAQQAITTAA